MKTHYHIIVAGAGGIAEAAALLQAVQFLLEGESKGIILQSAVDPDLFLNGNYIKTVYG